mmetsp:Transcript_53894/g.153680  ORF Transcript_53894/g.153680 Transcript_53894/m.153680 type:complete len:369 (-) Transcript_53894:3281-4387(-)
MFRSWKLRPAFARETHGLMANKEAQTPLMASQASPAWNSFVSLASPSCLPTSAICESSASLRDGGNFMAATSACASSKIAWASSLRVEGCNFPSTCVSFGSTASLFAGSVRAFCMLPYGRATAWGVRMSFGRRGRSSAKLPLLEPTFVLFISSGRTVHLQPRVSVRFIFTFVASAALRSASAALAASAWPSAAGRSAARTERDPSGLQVTSTHLPSKSAASPAEMAGSKQVAKSTPKLRARTAQWDRMSGASLALRTSTPTTPSGTSSSPLTAPLRRTVGVSNTLSCICSILSITLSSPWIGFATVEIICHGGRCANSRSTGSIRCSTRLIAISAVPRSTSSTNTSMACFGASMASPRKAALGPMKVW